MLSQFCLSGFFGVHSLAHHAYAGLGMKPDPPHEPLASKASASGGDSPPTTPLLQHSITPPSIPDHELLRGIGRGSYGEVWLARNVLGQFRAVKIVYRDRFEHERPYEREFDGIRKFEP